MGAVFAPYLGDGPLGALPEQATLAREHGLSTRELARAQFLTWLKNNHYGIFQRIVADAEKAKRAFEHQSGNKAAIAGLAQVQIGTQAVSAPKTWWQSAIDSLTQLATGALVYKGQKAAIEANLKRAEQGLPPIDYTDYTSPVIRTEVGVSPEIIARVKDTGNWVLWGALGIGAVLLVTTLARRR